MNKDAKITIRVTDAEKEALRLAALKKGLNISQLLREIIEKTLKEA